MDPAGLSRFFPALQLEIGKIRGELKANKARDSKCLPLPAVIKILSGVSISFKNFRLGPSGGA